MLPVQMWMSVHWETTHDLSLQSVAMFLADTTVCASQASVEMTTTAHTTHIVYSIISVYNCGLKAANLVTQVHRNRFCIGMIISHSMSRAYTPAMIKPLLGTMKSSNPWRATANQSE